MSGTCATLATIILAFRDGATAEEIAQHLAISYSNRKRSEQKTSGARRRMESASGLSRAVPPEGEFLVRWLADENFNNDILRGLLRRNPGIDVIRLQDADLGGCPAFLQSAAGPPSRR